MNANWPNVSNPILWIGLSLKVWSELIIISFSKTHTFQIVDRAYSLLLNSARVIKASFPIRNSLINVKSGSNT